MKRLLLLLALLPLTVYADQRPAPTQYGAAASFDFEQYNTDGTLDVDEVDSGTEITIHCNDGAGTTATNDYVDRGMHYSILLTAAELSCSRVTLAIASSLDHLVFITTCGTPSARHMNCPGGLVIAGGVSASALNTPTETIIDLASNFATDDLKDFLMCHVFGQVSGDPIQCRIITGNVGGTDAMTHAPFIAALPQNGEYVIKPDPRVLIATDSGGNVLTNVKLIDDGDPTATIRAEVVAANQANFDKLMGTFLNCEVNTANFAGSTTTFACLVTDLTAGPVVQASNDLEGLLIVVTSGDQISEQRFINNSVWDGANSELQLTISRALPATLADAVTVVIR